LERIFDSDLDLYAIFGQSTRKSKKPYKVGWMSRDQSKLIEVTHFKDQNSARTLFNDVVNGEVSPVSNDLYKDHQKYSLYEWENTYVEPFSISMNEAEMLKFARMISRKEGIKLPKITFIEEGSSSHYHFADYRIEFCIGIILRSCMKWPMPFIMQEARPETRTMSIMGRNMSGY
jgi:hypothetical protein